MNWFKKLLGEAESSIGRNQGVIDVAAAADPGAEREPIDVSGTSILCSLHSVVQLSLVESMLAGAGIRYGTAGQSGIGSLHPVTLFVRREDLERARELIDSLNLPSEVSPADGPSGRGTEPRPTPET